MTKITIYTWHDVDGILNNGREALHYFESLRDAERTRKQWNGPIRRMDLPLKKDAILLELNYASKRDR